jgi:hypothetical protein
MVQLTQLLLKNAVSLRPELSPPVRAARHDSARENQELARKRVTTSPLIVQRWKIHHYTAVYSHFL